MVAGVAALILSVNPNLTQEQVANIIRSTARKASPNGIYTYQTIPGLPHGTWNERMGYGVVDAYAAVLAASGGSSCIKIIDNKVINTNTVITGCQIMAKTVNVTNGAKLVLQAPKIVLNYPFVVQAGSSLVLGQ